MQLNERNRTVGGLVGMVDRRGSFALGSIRVARRRSLGCAMRRRTRPPAPGSREPRPWPRHVVCRLSGSLVNGTRRGPESGQDREA